MPVRGGGGGGSAKTGATFIVAASDAKDTSRADYVCDGVADEVEINAAIAALPAAKGLILLTEGTFNVDLAEIPVTNDISVRGTGDSTIIKIAADIHGFHVGDGATPIENVHISDMHFDMTGMTTNNFYAVWFDAVSGGATVTHSSATRLSFDGSVNLQNYAIRFRAGSDSIFEDNYFTNCTGHCLRLRSSQALKVINNSQGAGCVQVLVHCGYVDESVISGNISQGGYRGILLDEDSNRNLVEGNKILSTSSTGQGILLGVNSDDNLIIGNHIQGQLGGAGALATASGGQRNVFTKNKLYNNVTNVVDGSGQAIFDSIPMTIIGGTTLLASSGSPKGFEIDAASEYVLAVAQLPQEAVEIVRIIIKAVALTNAGGNAMEIEVEANGAAADEAYNSEAISVVNHASEESGYVINDIVTWIIDPSDDADIGDIVGGESLELLILHEVGSGTNNDTDCIIRSIDIMYV